jgi:hypothetical protein
LQFLLLVTQIPRIIHALATGGFVGRAQVLERLEIGLELLNHHLILAGALAAAIGEGEHRDHHQRDREIRQGFLELRAERDS